MFAVNLFSYGFFGGHILLKKIIIVFIGIFARGEGYSSGFLEGVPIAMQDTEDSDSRINAHREQYFLNLGKKVTELLNDIKTGDPEISDEIKPQEIPSEYNQDLFVSEFRNAHRILTAGNHVCALFEAVNYIRKNQIKNPFILTTSDDNDSQHLFYRSIQEVFMGTDFDIKRLESLDSISGETDFHIIYMDDAFYKGNQAYQNLTFYPTFSSTLFVSVAGMTELAASALSNRIEEINTATRDAGNTFNYFVKVQKKIPPASDFLSDFSKKVYQKLFMAESPDTKFYTRTQFKYPDSLSYFHPPFYGREFHPDGVFVTGEYPISLGK